MARNREYPIFNLGIACTDGACGVPSTRRISEERKQAQKLCKSNSPAITPPRELSLRERQDVEERLCFSHLDLDHISSQFESFRLNQRLLA